MTQDEDAMVMGDLGWQQDSLMAQGMSEGSALNWVDGSVG